MDNFTNSTEIPMGLGMAMAQNRNAMNYFASLTEHQQRQIIETTHQIRSKHEMQNFVNHFFKL